MDMIPYGRQEITDADVDAVIRILRSELITQGPTVPAFESEVAKYCNVNYAIAVNSATSALHIACLALGVGKNDIVWTSAISFAASANCAVYCGALVDFVDIDPLTFNLSVEHLAKKLDFAKVCGKLPKVIIPVHLSGQSCDMEAIYKLSQQYGFRIIEDASHSIGGKYKKKPIGNCCYSDIAVFSFHPVKIITTGEGGMAVTNSKILAKNLRLYRSHGITNNLEDMLPRETNEIWNYQQIKLGFNYRMTEIQGALGLSQMQHLDRFIDKRHQIANRYDKELVGLPLIGQFQSPESFSSYHLYIIRIMKDSSLVSQRHVYDALQDAKINCNLHYIPIYRHPYYEAMGFKMGYCPEAEQYFKEVLSIPIYTTLTDIEQTKVIKILHEVLK